MDEMEDEGPAGTPAWMATFADLVTQILCFFVFLFTMSSIETEKFQEALISFRGSFGIIPSPVSAKFYTPDEAKEAEMEGMRDAQMDAMEEELMEYAQVAGLIENMSVDRTSEGLIIRLTDQLVFTSGSEMLSKGSIPVLDKISKTLNKLPGRIRIEGHTDNVPITSKRFRSNWELSSARAMSVGRYLMDRGKVQPSKVSLAGYGEYKPIVPNNTSANRKRNRRVDIVFMKAK